MSNEFDELQELPSHGYCRLVRAKRYGRWYLLKSLKPEFSDKLMYQEMLNKELYIVMRLQHPGVVQALGMEEVSQLGRCIVLEWIEGQTLTEWLAHSPTPIERRDVMKQLLDAVAYIHSVGVVHRDLKPGNIMVTTTGGQVKLIDYGLADNDAYAVLKQPGGTKQYMSPEQAVMKQPDVRNDIYSLGIIMREMDLKGEYVSASHRCLCPLHERYKSVDELHRDLYRRKKCRRWFQRGLVTMLVIGMLTAGLWLLRPYLTINVDNKGVIDSLQNRLILNVDAIERNDSVQRQMGEQLSVLHDSLNTMNHKNSQLQQQQANQQERQQRIDAAIATGIARADAAIARTHLREHLDTVSSRNDVWLDYESLSRAGREETKLYILSLRDVFNIKELSEIEYAILNHCSQWELEVFHKVQKLAGSYDVPHY